MQIAPTFDDLARFLATRAAMVPAQPLSARAARAGRPPKSRIIRSFTGVRRGFEHLGRREWTLHATRGWRCRRA